MPESSIVFKANDEISGSMKSMYGNSQALSKQFEELQRKVGQLSQKNDAFNKSFASVSTQAMAAKKSLKEAEAAFKKTGDEESKLNFENAKKQYKDLTDAAKSYEEASRDTRKSIRETQEEIRKLGSNSGGSGAAGAGGSGDMMSGLGSGLLKAGLIRDLGNSVAGFAGTLIESAVGQPLATIANSTLSGAASGAAAGALLGPAGIAAGAAIGGLSGLVSAGNQIYEKKDDAFKSYVQENTESQLTQRDADIQAGSAVAAQREQDAIAFNTMLGNGVGDDYLKDLRIMAAKTPMEYSDLTAMSRSLATGFKDDPSRMLSLMTSVGNAGSAVGADANGMNTMATALARMQSSGKTSLEYVNLIQERGVDAIGMLADGLDKTKAQIYDMISKGQINGVNAVSIIQKAMDTMYDGAMEKQSQTFSGLSSTLEDTKTEMQAAYGAGYNAERSKGIAAETDYLSGISGQRQQEANAAIGAWQASLENAKEKAIRDAVDAAMGSNDYRAAQATGDAAKMGEIIARAKVQGQNEYNAGPGAQLALESERSLAEAIRNDASTNQNYWDAGYEKGNWYTKGLAAAIGNFGFNGKTMNAGNYNPVTDTWEDYEGSNAFGLRRVPETGLYLLHQDETVKTAAESREAGGSDAVKIEITGPVTVRQESDIKDVATELYRQIAAAKLRAD
ncbi:tape measure protein [Oscillibacter ruminantium]|uniref:tape measure protein n=1 Tax=Oscillibacter ruminantium TaxID=1263547 RepID=UPI000309A5D7|nr:tape measure protein [Oscillibacter ruminantium]